MLKRIKNESFERRSERRLWRLQKEVTSLSDSMRALRVRFIESEILSMSTFCIHCLDTSSQVLCVVPFTMLDPSDVEHSLSSSEVLEHGRRSLSKRVLYKHGISILRYGIRFTIGSGKYRSGDWIPSGYGRPSWIVSGQSRISEPRDASESEVTCLLEMRIAEFLQRDDAR